MGYLFKQLYAQTSHLNFNLTSKFIKEQAKTVNYKIAMCVIRQNEYNEFFRPVTGCIDCEIDLFKKK